MANTSLLQRLRERLRRTQQEVDEHRATAEDLQARLAASEQTRMKTALDPDGVPAVDISKQLIQSPKQTPPPKRTPMAQRAAAAAARRVARPSSQDALHNMAPAGGAMFGPAPSHSDARFQQHHQDNAPAPYLTGRPDAAAHAPSPPPPRRSFSLATPSPFGEAPPQAPGGVLSGAPSLAAHDDEEHELRPRSRMSSRDALLSLFSSAHIGSGSDQANRTDERQGPFLTVAAVLTPSLPPPPTAQAPRREFSLATPSPFDPPQPLGGGSGLTGAQSLGGVDEDDRHADARRRDRLSSHDALLTMFSTSHIGSGAQSFGDDRPRHRDDRPILTGAPTMLAPTPPPPPAAPPARREFSIATPAPAEPPSTLSVGTGLTGAPSLMPGETVSSGGWGWTLEGAPSLTPRSD